MFAERLSERRLLKKLTHQKMADFLGITRQAYGNYELGKRDVDTETLSKIADKLDTSVDYLLGRTDDPSPEIQTEDEEFQEFISNPDHNIFFKDYLSAPEERQRELRIAWEMIKKFEKGRKPGDRQGE